MLTQEMKDMIASFQCFIGTVSTDGIPNVAPKRSTKVLDDETLIFTESTGGVTYNNLLNASKVTIAVVNGDIPDGYRFLGKAELRSEGEQFNKAVAFFQKLNLPKPKAVVLVHIEEIFSLKPTMPGRRLI